MAGPIGGNDDEPIAAINVVPLVDVILVVLIIFMVTAPLVLKPSIDVNLPKASSGQESPVTPLNLTVLKTGEIMLNGKTADRSTISSYITDLLKKNPETAAILAADRDVTLDKLTQVIDIVKTAGVKKVAFSIEKK